MTAASDPPSRSRRPSRREEYLTPNQVADRLLVATVTVRQWASRGLLPSETTPGGHRRFRASDVDAFVARRRQELEQETRGGAPRSLLIIDDDPQLIRFLQTLLATHAPTLQVDSALDGFSAGIKCEAMRPDIVTLDLEMPEMDGFEVCRLLRSKFGAERPRIVMLSGYLTDERVAQALEAGANACVPKSTSPGELLGELGLHSDQLVVG